LENEGETGEEPKKILGGVAKSLKGGRRRAVCPGKTETGNGGMTNRKITLGWGKLKKMVLLETVRGNEPKAMKWVAGWCL